LDDFNFKLDGDTLKDYMIEVLFRELGIAPYLQEEQCDKALAPYDDATAGVASGKKESNLINLLNCARKTK
jgi:hypothetical protein